MTTYGLAKRFIALENKIDRMERSLSTSCSQPVITKGFANYLGILQHDVNQLMESRNEIRAEASLRSTWVADRIGTLEAHMDTVSGNAQIPNSRTLPEAKMSKASCL